MTPLRIITLVVTIQLGFMLFALHIATLGGASVGALIITAFTH